MGERETPKGATGRDRSRPHMTTTNRTAADTQPRSTSVLTPSRKVRDSQRTRVYRAEHEAFGVEHGRAIAWATAFHSVAQMRAYVLDVAGNSSVKWRFPHPEGTRAWLARLAVTDGRGRRSAAASSVDHAIAIPIAYRADWVLLHELAHILSTHRFGHEADFAPHGWRFAETYSCLVYWMLGSDAATALASSFEANRVAHRDQRPTTVPATDHAIAEISKLVRRFGQD